MSLPTGIHIAFGYISPSEVPFKSKHRFIRSLGGSIAIIFFDTYHSYYAILYKKIFFSTFQITLHKLYFVFWFYRNHAMQMLMIKMSVPYYHT